MTLEDRPPKATFNLSTLLCISQYLQSSPHKLHDGNDLFFDFVELHHEACTQGTLRDFRLTYDPESVGFIEKQYIWACEKYGVSEVGPLYDYSEEDGDVKDAMDRARRSPTPAPDAQSDKPPSFTVRLTITDGGAAGVITMPDGREQALATKTRFGEDLIEQIANMQAYLKWLKTADADVADWSYEDWHEEEVLRKLRDMKVENGRVDEGIHLAQRDM